MQDGVPIHSLFIEKKTSYSAVRWSVRGSHKRTSLGPKSHSESQRQSRNTGSQGRRAKTVSRALDADPLRILLGAHRKRFLPLSQLILLVTSRRSSKSPTHCLLQGPDLTHSQEHSVSLSYTRGAGPPKPPSESKVGLQPLHLSHHRRPDALSVVPPVKGVVHCAGRGAGEVGCAPGPRAAGAALGCSR